jgi:hypothetical protein
MNGGSFFCVAVIPLALAAGLAAGLAIIFFADAFFIAIMLSYFFLVALILVLKVFALAASDLPFFDLGTLFEPSIVLSTVLFALL